MELMWTREYHFMAGVVARPGGYEDPVMTSLFTSLDAVVGGL